MLKYNLRFILRGFVRFKSSFITNLIGLSTGLASVILIYLWVNDEVMVDKYFENGDRLFQVMEHQKQDGTVKTSGQTPDFLAETLHKEIPEVENATVVTPPNFFPSFTLSVTDHNIKGIGKFVSKSFFKTFSYPLISGNSKDILEEKTNIVLSEALAKQLFVTPESSIGKTVKWKLMGTEKETIVSGVYKDLPRLSSERFDFIVTFDSFKDLINIKDGGINWNNTGPFFTYILVKEGTNTSQLNKKLGKLLVQKSKNNQHRQLFIKSYGDNYLYGAYENGKQTGGRIEYVALFSTIAIIILLIACINFMNLSTAQALRKIKETGIKRILGAQQSRLVFQYLEEAFVITILSFVLAVLIVILVLPQFSLISGKPLELVLNAKTIMVLTILIVTTAITAGIYPALYLSRINPGNVLKGKFNSTLGELWARKGLVVFQFSVSVIFIVFVFVVYKQIEYIQIRNPGFNKDNIIYFEVEGKISQQPDPILSDIKKIPQVLAASSMLGGFVAKNEGNGMPGTVSWNGIKITINAAAVNYGLIELLGIQLKEGRLFSKDYPSDANKIIFNEAAVDALRIEKPVGKIVDGMEVLGVVRNFNYQSLHMPIKPYYFRIEPNSTSVIMVKIQNGAEKQAIQEMRRIYKLYNPNYLFNYSFLDTDYQEQYTAEQRVSILAQYATCLTILISCLGLLGLVTFTTEKRRKEIGIRKALGSSGLGITILLSSEFMKLVVLAVVIALPISYFIVNSWLNSFVYKIDLEWWYFIGAACMTLLICWLTVVSQTIKAAKSNPAIILKTD
jgi:putative ABC transport system permease protein